jgi:N-acetylglucosamine transport system substrate-binding protein
MEYFRILLSQKMARNFLVKVGSVMPITGSTDGVEIPPAMQSALDAVAAAGGETFNLRFTSWYPELRIEFENAFSGVLNGYLTPEEFAARVEEKAGRLRGDPDLVRLTRLPSGPLASN